MTANTWRSLPSCFIRLHPDFLKVLGDTYGCIVYQEQLQQLWQNIAGFTAPEAQEARKAVAKKWTAKLKPIKEKWIEGASKILGKAEAEQWWGKQETFGRYAFNRCLSKDTILHDPLDDTRKTILERFNTKKPFHMLSFDDGSLVVDQCVDIHDNGMLEVFRIEFEDGSAEEVTAGHKFLCEDGEYHEVSEIFNRGLEVREIGPRRDSAAT